MKLIKYAKFVLGLGIVALASVATSKHMVESSPETGIVPQAHADVPTTSDGDADAGSGGDCGSDSGSGGGCGAADSGAGADSDGGDSDGGDGE